MSYHRLSVVLLAWVSFGCAGAFVAFMGPAEWMAKKPFQGVSENERHGLLHVVRNHSFTFVLLDDRHVFVDREAESATFRVSPGTHAVEAVYVGGSEATSLPTEPFFVEVADGGASRVEAMIERPAHGRGRLVLRAFSLEPVEPAGPDVGPQVRES